MSDNGSSFADRLCFLALDMARWTTGGDGSEWLDALRGEVDLMRTPGERLSWAAGFAAVVARVYTRCAVSRPGLILLAAAAGLLVGLVDVNSAARWPAAALVAAAAVLGWIAPQWAWRWGVILGLGIPAAIAISGDRGPYYFDRFDAWYVLPLAIAAAIFGAWLAHPTAPPGQVRL